MIGDLEKDAHEGHYYTKWRNLDGLLLVIGFILDSGISVSENYAFFR